MLYRLKELLRAERVARRARHNAKLDAFSDPMAETTQWAPVSKMTTLYRCRKLRRKADGSLVFAPTFAGLALPMGLMIMGLWLMVMFAHFSMPVLDFLRHPAAYVSAFARALSIMTKNLNQHSEGLMGIGMGALFLGLGILLLHSALRPIVFDSGRQVFYLGFSFLNRRETSFQDIHALQLLTDLTSENGTMAELNLVLKDASRINVVGDPSHSALKNSAAEISQFITKPLWVLD